MSNMNLVVKNKSPWKLLVCWVIPVLCFVDTSASTDCDDSFTLPSGKIVAKWVSSETPGVNVLFSLQDPAGIEESNLVYLCRGKANDNRNKAGKLWIRNGSYYCAIPEFTVELKRTDFDLLDTKAGATSWVPYTREMLLDHAITAGRHPSGATVYICRGTHDGALLVGSLLSTNGHCYVPRRGQEHAVSRSIEILVVNAYGLAL